ncbi:MAG: hypothetical protein MI975_21710 [Cytophagales bacterium]|nr:hypothetical protein [Cytophagales bacterium]
MRKALVIVVFLLINSAPIDLFSQSYDTIYNTSYTGGSMSNYWCKIASSTFISGYQDFGNTVEIFANGGSNSIIYWGQLILRCKRQNSDPNGPPTNFQMHLYNSNLGSENIKAVQNNNVVDIYIRIPNTWTAVYYRNIIGGSSNFQFYSNQPLLQNLPSGTVYSCKEGDVRSEKVRAKNIETTEVKVNLSYWSDFVFGPDYDLKSLDQVEDFIRANGHLPDIPSAEEVKENGISLGEMDARLLQKSEELTLYVIEQQKEIKELRRDLSQLKNEN